eukprot:763100-Amphidinium_carterae.1
MNDALTTGRLCLPSTTMVPMALLPLCWLGYYQDNLPTYCQNLAMLNELCTKEPLCLAKC